MEGLSTKAKLQALSDIAGGIPELSSLPEEELADMVATGQIFIGAFENGSPEEIAANSPLWSLINGDLDSFMADSIAHYDKCNPTEHQGPVLFSMDEIIDGQMVCRIAELN